MHLVARVQDRAVVDQLGLPVAHEGDQARAGRQGQLVDRLADARAPGVDLDLDDLEVLPAQLQQVDQVVLGDLVLDEGHDPLGGADRRRDAEQVEVHLVARVVDPGDDLRHAVLLAGELGDDHVVLVVAGHRDDDVGRAGDAGRLKHVELGAVAVDDAVAELVLEHVGPRPLGLDHGHLVRLGDERACEVGAHLPAADDDREHHVAARALRAQRVRPSIAIFTGEITSKPRSP